MLSVSESWELLQICKFFRQILMWFLTLSRANSKSLIAVSQLTIVSQIQQMRDVEWLDALIKNLKFFMMRDMIEWLQKNATKNVYKELYLHNDLVSTEKEVIRHTETTDCLTLTHTAICMSDNSQKMQTSRDALINVTVLSEISCCDLLKRMRKKFDSLDEKLNEAQDHANDVTHTVSKEIEALTQLWRITQETWMSVLQQITRATENITSCEQSATVCIQFHYSVVAVQMSVLITRSKFRCQWLSLHQCT